MKRFFSVLAVAAAVIATVGCSKDEEPKVICQSAEILEIAARKMRSRR